MGCARAPVLLQHRQGRTVIDMVQMAEVMGRRWQQMADALLYVSHFSTLKLTFIL